MRRVALGLALALGGLHALPGAAAESGDAQRGEAAYEARCGGCHALAADRIGPRHAGLIGRRAGSVASFDYSPALRASTVVWDAALLMRWLADPEAVVPGQRMGYRLDDAQLRADIVAYLLRETRPR